MINVSVLPERTKESRINCSTQHHPSPLVLRRSSGIRTVPVSSICTTTRLEGEIHLRCSHVGATVRGRIHTVYYMTSSQHSAARLEWCTASHATEVVAALLTAIAALRSCTHGDLLPPAALCVAAQLRSGYKAYGDAG